MKKQLLDLKPMTTPEQIHEYLKFELDFPDHYGANLDALYDCLTDISEDTCIGLFYQTETDTKIGIYQKRIVKVFQDAEEENEYIKVIYGDFADNFLAE